jgi:hypothetical protein
MKEETPEDSTITESKQTFYQFVLNTLSAADFNTLSTQLELSPRMTTLRLRNPNLLGFDTIKKLVPILGADLKELVTEYELGYDALSGREYKQLMH